MSASSVNFVWAIWVWTGQQGHSEDHWHYQLALRGLQDYKALMR